MATLTVVVSVLTVVTITFIACIRLWIAWPMASIVIGVAGGAGTVPDPDACCEGSDMLV